MSIGDVLRHAVSSVDDVLITAELGHRPSRSPDYEAESRALATLAQELATNPGGTLQRLCELVLELCRADSAAVSIFGPGGENQIFRWHAAAGAFAASLDGTMPREAGPYGTVIVRDGVMLFNGADRVFPALRGVEPQIYESLLAPWHLNDEPIGTLWAIKHTPEGQFDAEDARLLERLANFAAAAWRTVIALQAMEADRHEFEARVEARTRELRESEERFRTLFESIDEGFCVIEVLFDAEGVAVDYRFEQANPAFERQTGLHEAVGKTARALVPDLEEYWFQIYGEVATTGIPKRFMQEAQPMDHRWFDVYAFRLGEAESHRVAILFTDISERKRVEADIARLAAIVESSHDAIFRCQLDGTIVDWNRGAEQLYGYTAAEIVGRDVAVLAPPERAWEQPEFLRRLQRGEDIPPLETVRRRKDGTLVEVEVRPSAVRDSAGHIVGIGVIARDVSARKRLERAQEDFLAMASHDLRSPVTVLRGRAQLMRRRKRYDETTVDAILEQARRIERLITDLQEVVQLEAGTIVLRRMPTDLSRLARDAVERIRPQARAHYLRLIVPDAPVVGQWDPDRLGQVLDNLLGNAVKYSGGGEEVTVQVEASDGETCLQVRDRGAGIPPEVLPRLFERFYRADHTGGSSGLGLGLYITRMLVEAHGGRIWAESIPGEGSTFTVVLPNASNDTVADGVPDSC